MKVLYIYTSIYIYKVIMNLGNVTSTLKKLVLLMVRKERILNKYPHSMFYLVYIYGINIV